MGIAFCCFKEGALGHTEGPCDVAGHASLLGGGCSVWECVGGGCCPGLCGLGLGSTVLALEDGGLLPLSRLLAVARCDQLQGWLSPLLEGATLADLVRLYVNQPLHV